MNTQVVQKTQKQAPSPSQAGIRSKFSLSGLLDKLPGGKGGYVAKILKVVIVAFVIILLLIIVFSAVLQLKRKQETADLLPVSSPTVSPPQEVKPTHPVYATDSVILDIEEDVRALDSDLISTDLEEANLNPPLLDLKITFEEK